MIYFVNKGDTLYTIAKKFGLSIESLMNTNVICNQDYVFTGQIIVIPNCQHQYSLPKAGGSPYYITRPGDTLSCIAKQFNISVSNIAIANNIQDVNLIFPNIVLLLPSYIPDAKELEDQWTATAADCASLNQLQIHGIFYIGSFLWEWLGEEATPYLVKLTQNSCDIVKYYALLSLGKITPTKTDISEDIKKATADSTEWVSEMANYVLARINLAKSGMKRVHILTTDNKLYKDASLNSEYTPISNGTKVIVLEWFIPTTEEGPLGGFSVYDYVHIVNTGQSGFLPRLGYNELTMV